MDVNAFETTSHVLVAEATAKDALQWLGFYPISQKSDHGSMARICSHDSMLPVELVAALGRTRRVPTPARAARYFLLVQHSHVADQCPLHATHVRPLLQSTAMVPIWRAAHPAQTQTGACWRGGREVLKLKNGGAKSTNAGAASVLLTL